MRNGDEGVDAKDSVRKLGEFVGWEFRLGREMRVEERGKVGEAFRFEFADEAEEFFTDVFTFDAAGDGAFDALDSEGDERRVSATEDGGNRGEGGESGKEGVVSGGVDGTGWCRREGGDGERGGGEERVEFVSFGDYGLGATAGVGEWEASAGEAGGYGGKCGVVRSGEAVDCLERVANCDETT